MVSQQYTAWLDCTDVQAGLALYWRQRLITFGSSRINVNCACEQYVWMRIFLRSRSKIFYPTPRFYIWSQLVSIHGGSFLFEEIIYINYAKINYRRFCRQNCWYLIIKCRFVFCLFSPRDLFGTCIN